jgi:hypothetical protein
MPTTTAGCNRLRRQPVEDIQESAGAILSSGSFLHNEVNLRVIFEQVPHI